MFFGGICTQEAADTKNGVVILLRIGDTFGAMTMEEQHLVRSSFNYNGTRERLGTDESFVAVLEVCGWNDWLIRMLKAIALWSTSPTDLAELC